MFKRVYVIFSLFVIALYAVSAFRGWEFPSAKRELLSPTVRSSPGGYRSYHFWHPGFHGGK